MATMCQAVCTVLKQFTMVLTEWTVHTSVYIKNGLIKNTAESEAANVENLLLGTFDLEENFAGVGAIYFKITTESDAFVVLDNFSVVQKSALAKADDTVTVGSNQLKVYISNFIEINQLDKIKVTKNGDLLTPKVDYSVGYQLKTTSNAKTRLVCKSHNYVD